MITSAALARPGPMAAAISAPVAPLGRVSVLPSGKVTAIMAGAADMQGLQIGWDYGRPWPAGPSPSRRQFTPFSGGFSVERAAEGDDDAFCEGVKVFGGFTHAD